MHTPKFRTTVPVEFRNKSVIRVSPTACSLLKLLNGGQRFFLLKDPEIGELGLRGVSADGRKFAIAVAERTVIKMGEIVELSCDSEEASRFEWIEVFEVANTNVVLSKIVVERPNFIAERKK